MEAKIAPGAPFKSDHRTPKSVLANPGRSQEFMLAPGGLPGPLLEASGEPPGGCSAPEGRPEGSRESFLTHVGSLLARFGVDLGTHFGTISAVFLERCWLDVA